MRAMMLAATLALAPLPAGSRGFTLPDGSTRVREGNPGEVAYTDAIVHTPVNIGDTDAHGIQSGRPGSP